jgi:hypothetical protein
MATFEESMKSTKYGKSKIPKYYKEYASRRDLFVDAGRTFARQTLPWIMPESGQRVVGDDQHGWQSTGARLANHLSNKIVNTLFPASRSHFKATLLPQAKAALREIGYSEIDVAKHLSGIEDNAQEEASALSANVARVEAAKHLVIVGNVCVYTPNKKHDLSIWQEEKMQVIPLDKYVCKRDNNGFMIDFITIAEKKLKHFTPDMQMKIKAGSKKKYKKKDKVKIYTRARFCNGMYEITQSADTAPLGEKQTIHPLYLPWNVLRWNKRYGEDYGGGLVEDYSGEFHKLEVLNEALAKGMILLADIKYLVKTGAAVDIDELVASDTGEYLEGDIDEIGILQLEKTLDFRPLREVINETERTLGAAFLMQSANRRDAERVTTYELRLDANELEVTLGGIYSLLAEDWQKPEARIMIKRLDTSLDENVINPVITTGLAALGKLNDLDKLHQLTEFLQLPAAWPEPVQATVDWTIYTGTIAANISLDTPWLKTSEQVSQDQANNRQQQLEMIAAQGAAKGIPDLINKATGEA